MHHKWLPKEEFEYCTARMPRSCIDLVFICKNEILLAKRKIEPFKEIWCLPGSSVLLGEELNETAIRVANNELGIDIQQKELTFVGIVSYFLPNQHNICLTYMIRLQERPSVKLDFQHSEAKWFNIVPDTSPNNIKAQVLMARLKVQQWTQ